MDEIDIFRRTLRTFCEERLAPLVARSEALERFPRERILRPMAELGIFRLGVPEELGGLGGGLVLQCEVAREIGRVSGSFAVSVLPSVLGPSLLADLGTREQFDRLAPPLMDGEHMAAIALTEPEAGSDVVAMRTVATPAREGFVLRGTKTFVTNAPVADLFLVAAVLDSFARRPGPERAAGIALFLVRPQEPGFRISRRIEKLGMRASETGEIVLDDCFVPAENRLGGNRGNFLGLLRVLERSRLYVAALSLGIAAAAFEAALGYAKVRKAFGKAIGDHQAIGFKLADMALELEAAELLVFSAARAFDRGEKAGARVSMAKLFASEASVRIANEALQIHGGYGYTTEFPVERYLRDARVGTIWEGTSEMQRRTIARSLGLSP